MRVLRVLRNGLQHIPMLDDFAAGKPVEVDHGTAEGIGRAPTVQVDGGEVAVDQDPVDME